MQEFIDPALIKKYNTNAPRYTSYPTALSFSEDFYRDDIIHAVQTSGKRDLSLYIHIPFCHSLCYYCGCNKIVTRHQDKADIYLDYLEKEIEQQARLFRHYKVRQVHLGGGTPSFLSPLQMNRLMSMLRKHFCVMLDAEFGIEIDPRRISLDYLDHLRHVGFNRISIGVQDTDTKVQQAINRVQSTEFVASLVERAKQLGFSSVNLDLIYGLPWQNRQTFATTLDQVLTMMPERLSLFSYAHLPSRFAAQRKIRDEWLPDAETKSQLMFQAIDTLTRAGYEFIGMDHFAQPTDELAKAQKAGNLHRNFQGYTTLGECDLLGLGVSSISAIGNTFSQNHKELKDYYVSLDEKDHALAKGVLLTNDDIIRAGIIKDIMCNSRVNIAEVERDFGIRFNEYFADALGRLVPFIRDGLVSVNDKYIRISDKARLLVRNIAMAFDAYAHHEDQRQRFSKVM